MTEYWVSKKQYFCKYCNIFIRDDAPSRTHHDTGLRHQGNKDRFLRNIYKTGEKAVREKENENRMMKKIEEQALATHTAAQPKDESAPGPSSPPHPAPPPKKVDKFANYSTASSLGFVDTQGEVIAAREAAEAERKKIGEAGQWQTVPVYEDPSNEESDIALATTFTNVPPQVEDEDVRNFAFDATTSERPGLSTKKRIRDVYDDEAFDPEELLRQAKFKQETKRQQEERAAREKEEKGLNRDKWKGIVLGPDGKPVVKPDTESQSEIKLGSDSVPTEAGQAEAVAPDPVVTGAEEEDVKPKVEANSLFKKRRPANANRSTRQK